jgi:hypothetical protein
MITLTVYRYAPQALPEEFYQELRAYREFMPATQENGLYDWYEPNARYYWTPKTLQKAKQLAFRLEWSASFHIEDIAQAKKLFKRFIHKSNGVQKTVPGAIAIQVVRRYPDGRQARERYQWGQLAHPSRAHRWCKVPVFSGIATEAENIELVE